MVDKKEPIYCPFCGEEKPIVKKSGRSWGVYCDSCNANIKGARTREVAILRWNYRFKPFE